MEPKPSYPGEWGKMSNILRAIFQQAGIIAAVLYFAGWIYLNSYYGYYDIDLGLLELGWHDVIAYSAALLNNGLWILIRSPFFYLALVIPIAFLVAEHFSPRVSSVITSIGSYNLHYFLPLAGLLAALPLTVFAAQYVGTTPMIIGCCGHFWQRRNGISQSDLILSKQSH